MRKYLQIVGYAQSPKLKTKPKCLIKYSSDPNQQMHYGEKTATNQKHSENVVFFMAVIVKINALFSLYHLKLSNQGIPRLIRLAPSLCIDIYQ